MKLAHANDNAEWPARSSMSLLPGDFHQCACNEGVGQSNPDQQTAGVAGDNSNRRQHVEASQGSGDNHLRLPAQPKARHVDDCDVARAFELLIALNRRRLASVLARQVGEK